MSLRIICDRCDQIVASVPSLDIDHKTDGNGRRYFQVFFARTGLDDIVYVEDVPTRGYRMFCNSCDAKYREALAGF